MNNVDFLNTQRRLSGIHQQTAEELSGQMRRLRDLVRRVSDDPAHASDYLALMRGSLGETEGLLDYYAQAAKVENLEELRWGVYPLEDVLAEALIEVRASKKNRLELESQLEALLYVRADLFHLRTVLREMLIASLTRRGNGQDTHKVRLLACLDDEVLTLTLADNGHQWPGHTLSLGPGEVADRLPLLTTATRRLGGKVVLQREGLEVLLPQRAWASFG